MPRAVIVAHGNITNDVISLIKPTDYLVGVDYGAVTILNHKLPLDLAIGDFDSVNKTEFEKIIKKAKEIKTYKKDKDFTDTELALNCVIDRKYKDIVMIGAFGSRFDHTLANIFLVEKYAKGKIQLQLIDNHNCITLITQKLQVEKNSKYRYYSIISLSDFSIVSLSGFKYQITRKKVVRGQTLCISNELSCKKGLIKIQKGQAILVKSRD